MGIDKKILSEIERYKSINKYIFEQAVEAPPALIPEPTGAGEAGPAAPDAEAPTPDEKGVASAPAPEPLDVEADPDVEKIDDEGKSVEKGEESGTEELDITDLVDSQKSIEKRQDEYFENLFGQIQNLERRLGEMDQIMSKLNSLEAKIEKHRQKTPEERLEMRVFDSYPFNQKLTDFFDDKKEEMEKTGKKDYVLTSDQVSDINVNDIKNSFQPSSEDRQDFKFR